MTQANPIDLTIQYKPEAETPTADELKHILSYFPDILKEIIFQTETKTQE
jgi:hypothetical protein